MLNADASTYLWNDAFPECVYFNSQFDTTQNDGIERVNEIKSNYEEANRIFLCFVYILLECDLFRLTVN